MRNLKFAVCLLFMCFAAGFWFSKPQHSEARITTIPTTLAAPTGMEASTNDYVTKVGLHWDTIRDATIYRVYRNTVNDSSGSSDVGTTAANYFFDTSALAGTTYWYWVRAENGSDTSPISAGVTGRRAVGEIRAGSIQPLDPPFAPAGNPMTAAKAYLGKTLFWDEQLSSTRTVACGTCHRPAEGGSDPRTSTTDPLTSNPGPDGAFGTADDIFASPGVIENNSDGIYASTTPFGLNVQVTPRKAPSYLNAGYAHSGLFWDGRASTEFRDQITNAVLLPNLASLESQSAGPPVASAEMAHTGRNWTQVADRIANVKPLALATNLPTGLKNWIGDRTYAQLFNEVYGTPDVTPSRISMAIATHERTLFSDRAPIDRWAAQIEELSAQEDRGRILYENLSCNICHGGNALSDQNFHNIGVRPVAEDLGRGAVTGSSDDNGRFKSPTMRNVELHGPYMHNGRFNTLEEVIEFYNRGGDFDAPNIDHSLIRQLNMTPDEKADLLSFLKRPLTDPRVANELPPFDRPKLFTESGRAPSINGSGRSGSGGVTPDAIAISPPMIGNPQFTVAIRQGLGGAQAVLSIGDIDPGVGASIPTSGSFAYRTLTLNGSGNGTGYGSTVISIPDQQNLIGRTFYGRWYITDASAANGFSVSKLITFRIFGPNGSVRHVKADFDGDGRTDVSTYRGSTQGWYILNSGSPTPTLGSFGLASDIKTPADYDGDGKTDIAVYRSGTWYMLLSGSGFSAFSFGLSTDIPQPADYDGDGKADFAVFRPSTGVWYLMQSTAGFAGYGFGTNGDKPVAADYDGDGKTDLAVYRNGTWYIQQTTAGFFGFAFGTASDRPVPADYDGDGKADVSVFRPSNGMWYSWRSQSQSFVSGQFGISTDQPAPGDYDGDGKADLAVFRDGTWYLQQTTSGFAAVNFGLSGDVPIPGVYVP